MNVCGLIWYVWYGVDRDGTVWYGIWVRVFFRYGMLRNMVWYGVVWYGMVWYGMILYGMVWHGTAWYGRVR